VTVQDVVVAFGETRALDGVSFEVQQGTVLGLLGPNGAGKTTAVRVLTTLLQPTSGTATVLGRDVVRQASKVRRTIGLAGQYAAVDENLTGRENIRLFGDLYHVKDSRRRAVDLLERFELTDAADRPARTYSGGMRRRLDLAASLVNEPQVLFLDEPTTGLDPRSRLALWDIIEDLVSSGTTLLLTTQYLEEADRLADTIAVIDHGKVIAQGTSAELKAQVGGQVLDIRVRPAEVGRAEQALRGVAGEQELTTDADAGQLSLAAPDGGAFLVRAATALQDAGVELDEISLRRPTLDDVFLTLTGSAMTGEPEQAA